MYCTFPCLRAVSHSSGTSSGWLKAIPQPSLGLALSSHDFGIALRIWLGVPLFPLSPLCTCLSVIDQFGDHFLGCSHGPLRIQCHDALVTVVHHVLLQDHPGVLREQGTDQSRPEDIYHPDLSLGRPAYFDLSVRCTTQSAFISSAASQAGMAAAAGEKAKDNQYLELHDLLPLMEVTLFSLYVNHSVFGLLLLCPLFLQLLTTLQLKIVCLGS